MSNYFNQPLDEHLFNSVAKRISERFHRTMGDLYEREGVGPTIEIGDIFVTYSRGNSLSSNTDHNDDIFGVKMWVPVSRLDKHMRDAITALYGQKPKTLSRSYYKLPIKNEEILSDLLNILKSE